MRLFLVRHGETEDISAKIHQRHTTPLSPLGHEQAQKIAQRLAAYSFEHIYVSPLTRTLQTFEHIKKNHPHTPTTVDERMKEIHYGIAQGQPSGTLKRLRDEANAAFLSFVPQGGESPLAVWERFEPFFKEFETRHSGDVLLVGHGYPMMFILARVHGVPFERMEEFLPKNCALTILERASDGTWHPILVNDWSHLG